MGCLPIRSRGGCVGEFATSNVDPPGCRREFVGKMEDTKEVLNFGGIFMARKVFKLKIT